MVSEISVRFAMDTWGIMFQTVVPGGTASETDGQLVEVDSEGAKSCCGESMQLG